MRVAAQEALALQCHQLMGDGGGAGQADRLADLAHGRRVAAPLDGVPDDLDHPALPVGEPRAVRPDARRSARQGPLVSLGIHGFVHRMHRLESALGTLLGSDGGTVCGRGHVGPSRWSPCWTTVVAFERLRQTHVRVKNRESPVAIMCLGVWLTRRLPNKRAHCCTLHRRMATSWVVAPVCHPVAVGRVPAPVCAGIPRPLLVALTVSPHVLQRYGCASCSPGARGGRMAHANTRRDTGVRRVCRANPYM